MSVDFTHANADYLPPGYKYPFLFKRVYLGAYYEPFLERLLEVKAKAAERGAFYYSVFGFRSFAEQASLRAAFVVGQGGKAAPAGLSAHQYGLADDSCPDKDADPSNGFQPNWDQKAFDILGSETAKAGLVWGASFGDRPHVQWPGYVNAAQLSALQKVWQMPPASTRDDMRLRSVWSYIDAVAGR